MPQILETLTEYCQGPCYENQACIAMHESNGLGIITALILNDINPLGKSRMDLVLELKNNASKLLLAIMESRTSDSENVAEKIIYNMNPKQLVDVACKAFHQEMLDEDGDEGDGEETVSPKVVGHNIYILCHQLALYNRDGCQMAIAKFLDCIWPFGLEGLWLRYTTLQNLIPYFPWIAPGRSMERKESNFAA